MSESYAWDREPIKALESRMEQLNEEQAWIEREYDPIDAGLLDVLDEKTSLRKAINQRKATT